MGPNQLHSALLGRHDNPSDIDIQSICHKCVAGNPLKISPVISPDMLFHGEYNYLLKKTILEHFFLKLCVVLLLLFLENNNKLTTGCYQSPLSTGLEYVRTHRIEKGIAKKELSNF